MAVQSICQQQKSNRSTYEEDEIMVAGHLQEKKWSLLHGSQLPRCGWQAEDKVVLNWSAYKGQQVKG